MCVDYREPHMFLNSVELSLLPEQQHIIHKQQKKHFAENPKWKNNSHYCKMSNDTI